MSAALEIYVCVLKFYVLSFRNLFMGGSVLEIYLWGAGQSLTEGIAFWKSILGRGERFGNLSRGPEEGLGFGKGSWI